MARRPLSAGFPVKEKAKELDMSGKWLVGPMGTKTYQYWTNFTRKDPTKMDVLTDNPDKKGFWSFITNLEPEDFEYKMTPSEISNFLYKMVDIYWSPETG